MTSSARAGAPPGSDAAWGELPLVVDTSAWVRGHLVDRWPAVLATDRLRVPPLVRLEILYSARDGQAFDGVADRLATLRSAPMTAGVLRAASSAMRTLAHRSAGAQRIPVVDYLVAAAAEELGAAVLHYDRDYDTLAEVLRFDSVWLAPAGTLP